MDRSTEVTLRSAVIISCMVFVPLWAIIGATWTTNLSDMPRVVDSSPSASQSTIQPPEPRVEPPRATNPTTMAPVEFEPASYPTSPESPPAQMAMLTGPVPQGQPSIVAPVANTALAESIQPVVATLPSSTSMPVTNVSHSTPTGRLMTPATHQTETHRAVRVPVTMQANPTPRSSAPADWFAWTETRLKQLGASQFILESAGETGGYRFRCKAPLAGDSGFVRHFEATGESALAAMQSALQQIEAWRASIR